MDHSTGFGGMHILLPDGTHRPITGYDEYSVAWADGTRRIGKDMAGGYEVSTVFLNIEHGGGMWFESMLFGEGDLDGSQWRYATKEEAVRGHGAIVQALRDGADPTVEVKS